MNTGIIMSMSIITTGSAAAAMTIITMESAAAAMTIIMSMDIIMQTRCLPAGDGQKI